MDTNRRIEGIGHQVKGAVMQSLGAAIGDAKLVADGAAERAIGDAKNSVEGGGDRLLGIDNDRVLGIGHQIKGALMQELGRFVGNPKLQSDGAEERLAGKEQNAAGGDRDRARDAAGRRDAAAAGNAKADASEDAAKR
jgi:uncharacterized protein YjbJ (UPF0337 family)